MFCIGKLDVLLDKLIPIHFHSILECFIIFCAYWTKSRKTLRMLWWDMEYNDRTWDTTSMQCRQARTRAENQCPTQISDYGIIWERQHLYFTQSCCLPQCDLWCVPLHHNRIVTTVPPVTSKPLLTVSQHFCLELPTPILIHSAKVNHVKLHSTVGLSLSRPICS